MCGVAHLLNAEGVTVLSGARTVLDSVSLGLDDGARVGVVGRNGDGKSTLLGVMARTRALDGGRLTHARGLRVSALSQTDDLDETLTVGGAVLGDVPEHAWAADARVRSVLDGLLADVGDLSAPVATLSGGQRRRTSLAHLLVAAEDVLLLDEPTNHLDVEGVAWLADHLRTRWPVGRGALVVVTHDRWFLDAAVERTWEVHDGVVDAFDGGYAAYVLARAERDRRAAATADRRANLVRKELAWLRRGPPARTSKPQFRIDAANALIANEPPARQSVALLGAASTRQGRDVIDVEGATVRLGDRTLLDDVTWRLGPGDRVGVVGVNGAGKTTLLRLITHTLPDGALTGGRVKVGTTVRAAVLSQHLSELDEVADLRVLQAVEREARTVVENGKEVSASSLVERLGFTAERAWAVVRDLSGGERRRLQLARLVIHQPNLLLLDEPTNDLDTDTLAAMEDVLDGFAGTLVVVSHDRYLLERTTDTQVALLGDGHLRGLVGGVEEYLALRAGAARAARAGGATVTDRSTGAGAPGSDAGSSGGSSAGGPNGSGASPGQVRAARKDLARIERQMERLGADEARLHAEMAANPTDAQAMVALTGRLATVVAEREDLEMAWLEAAELVG